MATPKTSTRQTQTQSSSRQFTSESSNIKAREIQMAPSYFLLVALLATVTFVAIASDPSPLQDFCVADIHSPGMNIHALSNDVLIN